MWWKKLLINISKEKTLSRRKDLINLLKLYNLLLKYEMISKILVNDYTEVPLKKRINILNVKKRRDICILNVTKILYFDFLGEENTCNQIEAMFAKQIGQ